MPTENTSGANTISNWYSWIRFDDQGVTIRNLLRTYRIGRADVRRFTDGAFNADGGWILNVVLRNRRTVSASGTRTLSGGVPPSETLVAVGQAAQRHGIPAELTGTIERGSFPATLLGTSGTITVTIRDAHLADDTRESILEVIQRTEPVAYAYENDESEGEGDDAVA